MTRVLIFPGLHDSGPKHWQTVWCKEHPEFIRVQQKEWSDPFPNDWIHTLETYVKKVGSNTVVAAHSLACITLVKWAAVTQLKIKGALLVAPADVERDNASKEIKRFAPILLHPLPFPSIVVASENDSYISLERARYFAKMWGSRFVNVGLKDHLGELADLGSWEEGMALLQQLRS